MISSVRRRFKGFNRMVPGLMASLLVIMLMQLQAWEPIEQMVNNQIMRWRGANAWDPRLVMISVDDKTLNELGQFPISRSYYAELLDRLREQGVSVVVFNLMLSDTISADILSADAATAGKLGAASRAATTQLARAMITHGRVVIGQAWSNEGEAVEPIPVLSETAIAVGHMRLQADRDGFTRMVEVTYNELPALGVAAAQAYSLEDELVTIPSDLSKLRLNWPGPINSLSTLSLVDVLRGKVKAKALEGKIVFVGYGATSGFAPMRTPFDYRWPVPGGYMHAAVVDNLLNQNWLRATPYSAAMGALLIGGPLMSWLLYRRQTLVQLVTGLSLSVGWIAVCVTALQAGHLLPVISPLVVMVLTMTSVIVWGRLQSNALLQVRSAFLSTMSHEIRTPLNAIVNLSEMLQETPLDDRQREYVETLDSSSQTLMALINDVLDFSKIESGQLMLEDYPVSITETVERSIELLAPRAAEKSIELVYAIAPTAPAMIFSDPVRLQQILSNLLSNAVKFTEVGEVSVRVAARPYRPKRRLLPTTFPRKSAGQKSARRTSLFWRLPTGKQLSSWVRQGLSQNGLLQGGLLGSAPRALRLQPRSLQATPADLYEVRFAVSDTGIGIPKERMAQLFKPFSQVSASTTRKYGGTGLGLSISKRLSERMGGDLWVKSTLGQGSTFYFTCQAQKAEIAQPTPEHLSGLKGTHLLVIDRNPTRREQLSRELQTLDIRLVQTASLSEAIVFIHNTPTFDGVILDEAVALRSSTVSAAIKNLRQAICNEQLPVILLSALKSEPPLAVSNATMLWKPVKQSSLHQALRSIRPIRLVPTSGLPVVPKATPLTPKPRTALPSADSAVDSNGPDGAPPDLAAARRREDLRILLAEDNRTNQRVAVRLLELLGYQADVVSSGIEVLTALKQQRYEVILMDMRMPEMDGVEATRQIRQMPQHRDIWIIAMTANGMAADRKRCFAVGMNDYLRKPIKREALDKALQRCPAIQQGLMPEQRLPG
ncbi:MAG: CHASE2 domain-containing protein [Cyanobacteria bacterium J06614_10]